MKLEQKVTSKDLSQELKKVGYPQDGEFWWVDTGDKWEVLVVYGGLSKSGENNAFYPHRSCYECSGEFSSEYCVAPLSCELGEFIASHFGDTYAYDYNNKEWFMEEINDNERFESETEADMRAECVLWLHSQGYIDWEKGK